jgi:hypothetical protein
MPATGMQQQAADQLPSRDKDRAQMLVTGPTTGTISLQSAVSSLAQQQPEQVKGNSGREPPSTTH